MAPKNLLKKGGKTFKKRNWPNNFFLSFSCWDTHTHTLRRCIFKVSIRLHIARNIPRQDCDTRWPWSFGIEGFFLSLSLSRWIKGESDGLQRWDKWIPAPRFSHFHLVPFQIQQSNETVVAIHLQLNETIFGILKSFVNSTLSNRYCQLCKTTFCPSNTTWSGQRIVVKKSPFFVQIPKQTTLNRYIQAESWLVLVSTLCSKKCDF